MTQPEALRLADLWEKHSHGYKLTPEAKTAAELRRLHAERTAADGVINDLAAKVRRLQTQRDELLAALQAMLTHMGMDEDEWNKPTFDQARAAIAKAQQ